MKIIFSVIIILLIFLIFAFIIKAGDKTEVRFPQTEAGKRAESYFKAFNSKNENDMRAYLEQNIAPDNLKERPIEQRMSTFRQIKNDLTTLEPVKILKESPDEIKLVARSANENWLELTFGFEKSSPHKLLGIRIMRLDEPPDLNTPSTPLTETEMLKELNTYMDGISAKDEFSGVVLLAKGDKPIFRKAYGLASKEYNFPNRVDTRFNLGSINKFMTRISIEQLEGQGKLRLDDTIGKYLPDYPNKEAAEKVTISQLLDMTSGIGDFFGEKYQSTPKDRIRTLSDYLLLFGDKPLLFEPGTNRQYSNGGYIVLGLIIEKVSGQTYFDYVRDHIYKFAGMENTAHFEADVPEENVASGYTNNWDENEHPGEPRRNNIFTRPARGSSAGGGYSTVDDLLKLIVALKEGKLSAPKVSEEISHQGIGIAGGAPGINAGVETNPETDYTIIVLSNYDPPTAQKVTRQINSYLERLK
ncbi:MAG TPA: serine hydrolase domain-containing protein [Terriglobales bacterium]|nr:serine hydrolase domain-containing protein [Terriglobales bacterium]